MNTDEVVANRLGTSEILVLETPDLRDALQIPKVPGAVCVLGQKEELLRRSERNQSSVGLEGPCVDRMNVDWAGG
jgi:hypothetical protein